MTPSDAFFIPGNAADPGYRNVRDLPHCHEARTFTQQLWQKYRHLADTHFLSDARNHFNERFWEMYLGCTLIDKGFDVRRVGNVGPEFYVNLEGRRVWVEAVAPGPGTGADHVTVPERGEMGTVPSDKIVLRYTSALRDKHLKLRTAIDKGIVHPEETVILAVNSRGIPHAPFGGEMPYIIKAMLPFGALSIAIDPKTRKVVDTYHQYRPVVLKSNQAAVSTMPFLDPQYSVFAGILHSAVDCANHPATLGEEFLLLHNPTASTQLPRSAFSWCRQLEYADNQLHNLTREG